MGQQAREDGNKFEKAINAHGARLRLVWGCAG